MTAWLFGEHHAPTAGEINRFVMAAGLALWNAGFLWLAYVALEPFGRRRWPNLLIAWNRVLAGCFRDPLVGRDLLAGCVMGVVWVLLNFLRYPAASWSGARPTEPQAGVFLGTMYLLSGAHATVAGVSGLLNSSVFWGFGELFWLFLLRVLLKSTWAAATVFTVLMSAGYYSFGADSPLINGAFTVLLFGATAFVTLRFGPVAVAAQFFFGCVLMGFPITTQLSTWYSGIGLTGLGLLLALTLYAFYTSLGGQPLFGRAILEE
jgi:hypothetical protein